MPSMSSTEIYQKWVDSGTMMVDNTLTNWENIPPERQWLAHYGIGLDLRMVAVGCLALGRVDEARSLFRRSAEAFSQAIAPDRDNVSSEMSGLECAVLTGDRVFARDIARLIPEFPGKRKPAECSYVMFLKFLLLDDDATALLWAQEAGEVNPTILQKRGGYGNLGSLCLAIVESDELRVESELLEMLSHHERKARLAWRSLPQGYICLPGTVLTSLAHRRNLKLKVTSKYIPTVLVERFS